MRYRIVMPDRTIRTGEANPGDAISLPSGARVEWVRGFRFNLDPIAAARLDSQFGGTEMKVTDVLRALCACVTIVED